MYDIIGDIHGYADELEQLLTRLGYDNKSGYYSHPDRKAIFVGDFIDRGPKIRETLFIVRSMIENDAALATMGNHEYNALCYHTHGTDGKPLRKHNIKNKEQHEATLDQFTEYADEWKSYLNWFRDLPVFLELEGIRIIHACWDRDNIASLPVDLKFTEEFLIELHSEKHYKRSALYFAIHECLKGREHKMPEGASFCDKTGNVKYEMRIKWYRDPRKSNYEDYYMEDIPELNGKCVDINSLEKDYFYDEDIPVICGHYWFRGNPQIESGNVACVDYSVAKEGKLIAYRWNGEKVLTNDGFVWVDGVQ
ncbi:MAG: metallophosphoesterase [bacterium]